MKLLYSSKIELFGCEGVRRANATEEFGFATDSTRKFAIKLSNTRVFDRSARYREADLLIAARGSFSISVNNIFIHFAKKLLRIKNLSYSRGNSSLCLYKRGSKKICVKVGSLN